MKKFMAARPFAVPDAAARKLIEIANGVEAVQNGRIYIERVNAPFSRLAVPATTSMRGSSAIALGWIWMHESGTYVEVHRLRCGVVCLINSPKVAHRAIAYRLERFTVSGAAIGSDCLSERYSGDDGGGQLGAQRQTFVLYAICVSKKKSASGLTIEFIATCNECTRSPCCLTYSYAACSRSKSG